MSKKIYVGNLHYDVTEQELSQLFSRCGIVVSARIVKDPQTGRSKGYGFVEMQDDSEARQAIQTMNSHDLHGRPLMVDEAQGRQKAGSRR